MLPGIPAPDGLEAYPRPLWAQFFREMGTIARSIHATAGDHFGPVAGPSFETWSEAILWSLDQAVADLENARLDSTDVRALSTLVTRDREVLDEITEPRLLHGDLWTANIMIDPAAPDPTITGVCDGDRTSWGDPQADWTIYRASQRPGTERDAFWDTYGKTTPTPASNLRAQFYRARHVVDIRLERLQLGKTDLIADTYNDMSSILELLGS